jgi:hypothetical protein
MQDMLQQLFNFYFRGGWLWLAFVPLLLLIVFPIDNQRRQPLIGDEQYDRADVFGLEAIGKSETALNGVILGEDARQLYGGDRIRPGTVELTFFTQAGR